jgi:hypothetical protein
VSLIIQIAVSRPKIFCGSRVLSTGWLMACGAVFGAQSRRRPWLLRITRVRRKQT